MRIIHEKDMLGLTRIYVLYRKDMLCFFRTHGPLYSELDNKHQMGITIIKYMHIIYEKYAVIFSRHLPHYIRNWIK